MTLSGWAGTNLARLTLGPETAAWPAFVPDGAGGDMRGDVGRNSSFVEGWLPPDPPPGHGEHEYIFQLFALSEPLDLDPDPGRSALLAAMDGKVIGLGLLTGTYARDAAAPLATGTAGAALA